MKGVEPGRKNPIRDPELLGVELNWECRERDLVVHLSGDIHIRSIQSTRGWIGLGYQVRALPTEGNLHAHVITGSVGVVYEILNPLLHNDFLKVFWFSCRGDCAPHSHAAIEDVEPL